MRAIVSILLSALLLACPFLCGADEIGHQARHEHASGEHHDDPAGSTTPDQCPARTDDCVCRGAVPAVVARADLGGLEFSAPLLPLPTLLFATSLHHHLSWEGSPTGLAGRGDALTIRAFLQNYRW